MKKNTRILILVATVFALPCMSLAKPPKGDRASRPSKEEILAKFDSNADGKLSPQERVLMLKERMKRHPKLADKLMKKFDGDKNGTLSDEELLEAAKKMRKGKKGKKGGKKSGKAEG